MDRKGWKQHGKREQEENVERLRGEMVGNAKGEGREGVHEASAHISNLKDSQKISISF